MTDVSIARLEVKLEALEKQNEQIQKILQDSIKQNREAHKFFYENIEKQGRAIEIQNKILADQSEQLEENAQSINKHEKAFDACGENVKMLKDHLREDIGMDAWLVKKTSAAFWGIVLFLGGILATVMSEHILLALRGGL